MTSKKNILDVLSQKKGAELIQFAKEYSSFFKLDGSTVDITPANQSILDGISKLNASELIELRDELMSAFSIAMEDIVTVGSAQVSAGPSESAVTFKVIFKTIDEPKKTSAIKTIKDLSGLSISESKAIVDGIIAGNTYTYKEGLTKEKANEILAAVKDNIHAEIA